MLWELRGFSLVLSGLARLVGNLRGVVRALRRRIYVTPRVLPFFWRGFLVILSLFRCFLYFCTCSQGSATIWRGDVCGGDIGATQHVVWSWAPRQIFLRSGI